MSVLLDTIDHAMATAEFSNVFPYRDEVVVELAVRDPDRDVEVHSFQFDYRDESTLTSKGTIGAEFRADIEAALAEEGFELAD
jgi:hypothetical protein